MRNAEAERGQAAKCQGLHLKTLVGGTRHGGIIGLRWFMASQSAPRMWVYGEDEDFDGENERVYIHDDADVGARNHKITEGVA